MAVDSTDSGGGKENDAQPEKIINMSSLQSHFHSNDEDNLDKTRRDSLSAIPDELEHEKDPEAYNRTFHSWVDPNANRFDTRYYAKGEFAHIRPMFSIKSATSNGETRDGVIENSVSGVEKNALEQQSLVDKQKKAEVKAQPPAAATQTKFGTWDGVFVSCLLNIFGVIMFLRVGWMVGQAGIGLSLVIVLLSTVVVMLTALSMSAICTNGEIRAGGAYYMISRSLGPSVGTSVGVIFSIGMSVAVALYVIGFMETLVEQLGPILTGNVLNDTRIWGIIMCVILLIMALIGVGWVIKVQIGLLVLLVAAILSFVFGSFTPTKPDEAFVGWGSGEIGTNFGPDFTPTDGSDTNFVVVFSVFFPAVTGIMAGANISGDLKNPSEAIPVGTISAVGVSSVVYCLLVVVVGAVCQRGFVDGEEGLINNFLIMTVVSGWGPLVLAGIYAATFSSALASLVGAPRILQSVAKDELLPVLIPFKTTRANGDPVRAYFVSFTIACACVLIGELNLIAPLITMFFMMTYALINFACFQHSLARSPGWRPEFKYYNKWTALFGGILCIVMMFILDYVYAIIASAVAIGLYKYIDYKKPEVNWGSATDGRAFKEALTSVQRLRTAQDHVKNWRPNYLVLTGRTETRMHLVNFVHTLRKGWGATFLANIVVGDFLELSGVNTQHDHTKPRMSSVVDGLVPEVDLEKKLLERDEQQLNGIKNGAKKLEEQEVLQADMLEPASVQPYFVKESTTGGKTEMIMFHVKTTALTLKEGISSVIQTTGVGRLRPNTLVLGWKNDWAASNDGSAENYVNTLRVAFANVFGVMICRNLDQIEFNTKRPNPFGTVDIWWLLDDGGLSVLIPHIMAKSQFWKGQTQGTDTVPIRLFIISEGGSDSDDFRRVSNLIRRFRLDNIEICAVSTDGIGASQQSYEHYQQTIVPDAAKNRTKKDEKIKKLTDRWLRVSELVKENSSEARLVYCTVPFPRPSVSAHEYLSWLEMLSEDMPPMIMIRGSGQSVLTWYSE